MDEDIKTAIDSDGLIISWHYVEPLYLQSIILPINEKHSWTSLDVGAKQTSKYIFFYLRHLFLLLQDGEKLSNKSVERRCSAVTNKVKIGNSHASVIESTTSLYSNDDRRSSTRSTRLGTKWHFYKILGSFLNQTRLKNYSDI